MYLLASAVYIEWQLCNCDCGPDHRFDRLLIPVTHLPFDFCHVIFDPRFTPHISMVVLECRQTNRATYPTMSQNLFAGKIKYSVKSLLVKPT